MTTDFLSLLFFSMDEKCVLLFVAKIYTYAFRTE